MLPQTFLWALRTFLLAPVSAQLAVKRRAAALDTRSELILYVVLLALLARKR